MLPHLPFSADSFEINRYVYFLPNFRTTSHKPKLLLFRGDSPLKHMFLFFLLNFLLQLQLLSTIILTRF